MIDGASRKRQLARHLFVGQTSRQEPQDLDLARDESGGVLGSDSRRLVPGCVQHRIDRLRVQLSFAGAALQLFGSAEELHFARAAEKLHIEQSPLSRAIKELEYHLGVQLFERTTRRTQLTWAGKVFLEEAHRIFAAIEQATASVKAAATGYRGRLRIGCQTVSHSQGFPPCWLSAEKKSRRSKFVYPKSPCRSR